MISKSTGKSTRGRLYRGAGMATLAVLAAISLAACGDDDDSGDDSTAASAESTASTESTADTTTAAGGGGETVAIKETEFALDPSDPTVKAGTVTFDVSNDGQTVHSLEVEGPNGEQELDADLEPGQSGKLTVDLSEPGTYEMYCPIGDHKDQGMEGEITVTG